jgi:hypothetical protein
VKALAFAHYTDIPLTIVGLCLFLTVFFGVLWWTGLKMNKAKYAALSHSLFNEEKQNDSAR